MGWVSTLAVTDVVEQSFIDLATFKADHGITSSAYDAILQRTIDRACTTLVREIGRDLLEQTYTQTIEFTPTELDDPLCAGLEYIQLAAYPVTGITSVVEGETTLATTDWRLDAGAGLLYRLGTETVPKVRHWKASKLVVVYTAGFATVPDDLEEAASVLAWDKYKARNRDRNLQSKFVDGVDRVEYFDPTKLSEYPQEVQAVIDAYRGPRFR